MNPHIEVDGSVAQATQAAQSALERAGLRVLRSFELGEAENGSARAAPDGSTGCACAFAVLLVYPSSGPPAAVTSRAEGDRTRFEIVLDPNAATDASLVDRVLTALGSASKEPPPPFGPGAPARRGEMALPLAKRPAGGGEAIPGGGGSGSPPTCLHLSCPSPGFAPGVEQGSLPPIEGA